MQTSFSVTWKAEAVKQLALRGWTYEDLARETGLSRSVINRYMSGNYTNDNPRSLIDRALGMG